MKEKYIAKLEAVSSKMGMVEPSVTHTDLPSFNMPKRNSHSLSPTPISPTGWYDTPIFSVMDTKTHEHAYDADEEDQILRPIIEPVDSIMTMMSISTDHEFSISATLSSPTARTPQVSTVSTK